MRFRHCLLALMAMGLCATAASADIIAFAPNPSDLNDLDHSYYYTWKVAPTQIDLPVASATLTFTDIRNWDSSPNVLYVHLLDSAKSGVRSYYDSAGGGDAFAGQGIELVVYRNLSTTPTTLSYDFDAGELGWLNQYLANGGDFAIGFDPDCHFYNSGISLTLAETTTPVPEPVTLGMLLLGGCTLLAARHRMTRRVAA